MTQAELNEIKGRVEQCRTHPWRWGPDMERRLILIDLPRLLQNIEELEKKNGALQLANDCLNGRIAEGID